MATAAQDCRARVVIFLCVCLCADRVRLQSPPCQGSACVLNRDDREVGEEGKDEGKGGGSSHGCCQKSKE